jgi:hypothetical protein
MQKAEQAQRVLVKKPLGHLAAIENGHLALENRHLAIETIFRYFRPECTGAQQLKLRHEVNSQICSGVGMLLTELRRRGSPSGRSTQAAQI